MWLRRENGANWWQKPELAPGVSANQCVMVVSRQVALGCGHVRVPPSADEDAEAQALEQAARVALATVPAPPQPWSSVLPGPPDASPGVGLSNALCWAQPQCFRLRGQVWAQFLGC